MSYAFLQSGPDQAARSARSLQWVVAALVGLGVIMVFSTRAPQIVRVGGPSSVYEPLLDQGVKLGVGAAFLLLGLFTRPARLLRLGRWMMLVALALLVLVLVPELGAKINGARRWFSFGPGFQPVEFARIALIVFLAAHVHQAGPRIRELVRGLLPPLIALIASMVLLLLQPDFGSAIFFLGLGSLLLILGGARLIHFCMLAAVTFPVAVVYGWNSLGHVQSRVQQFLEPGMGHQAVQSVLALGAGGLAGTDLGSGTSKLGYLPQISSDFILAAVGEELGFAGSSLVVLLFALFLVAGTRIALAQTSTGRFLLAAGIAISIATQAIVNIAVVTAAVPTKGIALPFVSAGGSSLAFSLFAVGLLIRLARLDAVSDAAEDIETDFDRIEPEFAAELVPGRDPGGIHG